MKSLGFVFVLLSVLAALPAEGAKVLIDKEMLFSPDGHLTGHRDIGGEELEALHASLIADYDTFLAVEVAEGDLPAFIDLAGRGGLPYEIRRDFDVLKINGFVFQSSSTGPALPQNLSIASYDGQVGLYLVQFKAPASVEWIQDLRSVGESLAYFPENTFLVRTSPQGAGQLQALAGVQHVSLFQPAYKIPAVLLDIEGPLEVGVRLDGSRDLSSLAQFLEGLTSSPIRIRGDSGVRSATLVLEIQHIIQVAERSEVLWIEPVFSIELSGERQAMVVAGLHDGSRPLDPEDGGPHDGYEEWLLDKGFCTPSAAPYGCIPYWTKVAVFDSGLNTMVCPAANYNPLFGTCSAWSTNHEHPDLNHASNLQSACAGLDPECYGPVLQGFYCSKDSLGDNQCLEDNEYDFGDARVNHGGHGTATASIIASMPTVSPGGQDDDGYFRASGLAPSAQVLVAKLGSLYAGPNAPGMSEYEYEELMVLVNDAGARFSSNSWNFKHLQYWHDPNNPQAEPMLRTGYTGFSAMVDKLVRDSSGESEGPNDPMTIVFSAGNVPSFANPWVTSPGNAKNAISVGATRGWSTAVQGGAAHDECPEVAREISDVCGGEGWHSRRMYIGEDDSGYGLPRFKPDLVVPGSQIAAARAQDDTTEEFYRCFAGTSAAAPAVAAAAILADTWYRHVISDPPLYPSPAMVKAMLVAHAENMEGGTDWLTGNTLPNSPSPAQGWGRVNLGRQENVEIPGLFQDAAPVTVFDEDHETTPTRRFTNAGQYWSVELEAEEADEPIVAVLAYTDAPSEPTASGSLIQNNLTMRIIKPGTIRSGKFYVGNRFATGSWYSQNYRLPVAIEDPHNNVEVIRVPAGQLTSPFTLKVSAQGINAVGVPGLDGGSNNQDFALYVYNAVETQ